jgi:murein DD-endopeptidase MepM/ murein hydrolase activator NlpD
MVTRYGHLDKIIAKRGTRVKRGDKIATMGNTGRSTGPHVHYEIHMNGIPVNPEKYILN